MSTPVIERPASPQTERTARPTRRRRTPRAPRSARPPAPPALEVLTAAGLVLAIAAGWMVLQLLLLSQLSHDRDQAVLYDRFRSEVALGTTSMGPVIEPGEPVALIEVPRLGISEVVVEGTASGDLRAGPGHRRDTVLPGQAGVSVLAGRALTYGAPFGRIAELQPGDVITTVAAQGEQVFTVTAVRREGDPLPGALEDGEARLTLVTADAERLGSLRIEEAVYVDATAAEGWGAPPGRAVGVPAAEQPMAGEPSALPLVALCLAGLVAAVAAVVALQRRLSTAVVWVLATPVVLALAWATTDAVVRLIPNLL